MLGSHFGRFLRAEMLEASCGAAAAVAEATEAAEAGATPAASHCPPPRSSWGPGPLSHSRHRSRPPGRAPRGKVWSRGAGAWVAESSVSAAAGEHRAAVAAAATVAARLSSVADVEMADDDHGDHEGGDDCGRDDDEEEEAEEDGELDEPGALLLDVLAGGADARAVGVATHAGTADGDDDDDDDDDDDEREVAAAAMVLAHGPGEVRGGRQAEAGSVGQSSRPSSISLFDWALGASPAGKGAQRACDAVRLLPRTPHYSAIANAAAGVVPPPATPPPYRSGLRGVRFPAGYQAPGSQVAGHDSVPGVEESSAHRRIQAACRAAIEAIEAMPEEATPSALLRQ